MKLYRLELRANKGSGYVDDCVAVKIVSQSKIVITICNMLNEYADDKAYVVISHVECDI